MHNADKVLFVQLLDDALLATLMDPTLNVTVLLPPEDDLAVVAAALQSGQFDTMQVLDVLLNHIIPEIWTSDDLVMEGSGMIPTLNPDSPELEFMVTGGTVEFTLGNSTATVTEPDLEGCAGDSVIHKISDILTLEMLPATIDTTAPGETGTGGGVDAADNSSAFSTAVFTPTIAAALAVAGMLL